MQPSGTGRNEAHSMTADNAQVLNKEERETGGIVPSKSSDSLSPEAQRTSERPETQSFVPVRTFDHGTRTSCTGGGKGTEVASGSAPGHDNAGGNAPAVAATLAGGPVGEVGSEAMKVPSLQHQCIKVLVRNISVYNCLELIELGRSMEGLAFSELVAASQHYVTNSFETLQGIRSDSQLRLVLTDEVYENLMSAQLERAAAVEAMRRLGRVVERTAAGKEASAREDPSIAGRPVSYPLEALLSGVAWPPDVESSSREEWLSVEDFKRLFGGLSWESYCKLPGWKRDGLKKASGLF